MAPATSETAARMFENLSPPEAWRLRIASMTTMESSTTRPTEIVSAPRVSMLRVSPPIHSPTMAMRRESGMEMAVMIVARTDSRKTRMTRTAKIRPSPPSLSRSWMDCSMNGAWSNAETNSVLSPIIFSSSGSLSATACETSTVFASDSFITDTDSDGWPLVREIDSIGSSTSLTSATSETLIGPSLPEMTRSLIASIERMRVPTSTGAVPSAPLSSPAEVGTPLDWRIPATSSRLAPSSSRSSRRMLISTCLVFAPAIWTWETPSTFFSSGTTKSSRFAASWSSSASEVTDRASTGISSVPIIMTFGSTPSGRVGCTWETARCRALTTSSESSPYFVLTVICELPAEDVEVMSSTSGRAVSAPSRGSVTSDSTASGVAPS